jgi:uncharacterized protein with HEPN domain
MPVNKKQDFTYLWDMREAAREISEFVQDVSRAEFEENNQLRYAVERQLMVIGEAANHVSSKFQEIHFEIPWAQIIGQRNVLAHDYGTIVTDRVWRAATISVPELLEALEKLLPE